jgi:hypothetical protein
MSEPRFVVTELIGWPIVERADGRGGAPTASYFVQDTLRMWEVVTTVANRLTHERRSRADLRRRAERIARRLNEAWDAECARG